jgi:CheY-like chemotaxis protein
MTDIRPLLHLIAPQRTPYARLLLELAASYTVVEATQLEHATGLRASAPPRAVLLALALPQASEYLQRFAADPAVPVLVCASAAEAGALETAFAAGAVDMLELPLQVPLALARIHRWVGR